MSLTLASDLEFEASFALAVAETVGSVRALTVYLLVKYQEWQQLVDLDIDPKLYEDAGTFADDYLVTKLLSKSANLPLGIDLEGNARAAFRAAEQHNYQTNRRLELTDYVDHPEWFHRFVKRLRTIMGPLNAADLSEIEGLSHHGPGAVVGVKGGVAASEKFDRSPTYGEQIPRDILEAILPRHWVDYALSGRGFLPVPGGVFFTAPKDAKSRRGCAFGSSVSTYVTLGIGAFLAKRLKLFGVNLEDQTVNQTLASQAQALGLATIDLSQASDLLAKKLPEVACTDRWYHLLDMFRDRKVLIDVDGVPTWVATEKFCAMGNGFTFALETCVFLACVQAIVPPEQWHHVSCYGDDIICPTVYAEDVITALSYLGFRVNKAKTFLAGRFFESCGTDWFDGQNVRPFFLRKDPTDINLPYPVLAANQLRLWANRRVGGTHCDARFKPLWEACRNIRGGQVPLWKNLIVPPHLGEAGFVGSPDEAKVSHLRLPAIKINGSFVESGWEGFDVKCARMQPVQVDRCTIGVLIAGLARMERRTGPSDQRLLDMYISELQDGFTSPIPPKLLGLLPSRGKEPLRNQYRVVLSRWTWSREWPKGFCWA